MVQEGIPLKKNPPGLMRKMLDPREIKWRLFERGHEKPGKIYRSRAKAEKRVADADFSILSDRYGFMRVMKIKERLEKRRELEKSTPAFRELVKRNEELKNEALSWMDEEYVGETVFARMQKTPPVLVTFLSPKELPSPLHGAYYPGTNCMHTASELIEINEKTDAAIIQISHELHHYAAWLGGGMGTRWRDLDGKPHFRQDAGHWLGKNIKNEGLNESLTMFLSKKAAYGRGIYSGKGGTERAQAMLGIILESVVGEKEIREACFYGDYSRVFSSVEGTLGQGAFNRILEYLDVSEYGVWGAVSYMADKIGELRAEVRNYWEDGLGGKIFDFSNRVHYIPEWAREK